MNNETHQIQIKTITYQPELAKQLFSLIEAQPWAMLLRSASTEHIDSRFDILVAQPIATLKTKGEITEVQRLDQGYSSNETIQSTDDPFSLLSHYQNLLLPSQNCELDVPFVGGALGYFSYDLGRRVESVDSIAVQDIDCADMAVGLYEWAVIVDNKESKAYVIGLNVEQHWQWLNQQVPDSSDRSPFKLTAPWQSNMTKATYSEKFHHVQNYLLAGDCYQINLAQRFCAPYLGSEWNAYQSLEAFNLAPFSAFIRTDEAAIISVSPERFLELNQTKIETKPIKGTRPRSKDEKLDREYANDLAHAEKDQAENLMIVDLLRNDIGRVAKPGTVHVPKLFDIESFPAVHHLVSTIRADLDAQYQAADLLRACFPGGSITGAPKIRAMQIIEELEPHRRSVYCGSIGYISRHGRMDTSITIRTLVAEENMIYAWAGGGVVADSQCDSEYQETLDKLCRILPILTELNADQ
ncbi:aminodeoxychorismate synthase component I [Vibrio cortegadensis]|uniref:aminodeoxychorismate synthase component I n=1 Tax=Vibrio cortegadensis TaxID=1328770 RepID=UPI00352EBBAA